MTSLSIYKRILLIAPPIMYTKLLIISILSIGIGHAEVDMNSLISSIFDLSSQSELSVTDGLNLTPTTEEPETGHFYKTCGQDKECVPEYLCINGKVNRNGVTLIDIRSQINYNEIKSSEENYTITEDNNTDDECPYLETCCFVGNKDKANTVDQRIELSWIVLIYIAGVYRSNGVLITPRVALTAAHKFQRKPTNRLIVCVGGNKGRQCPPDKFRRVVDMIAHKEFYFYDLQNDITLLFLESPFDITPNKRTLFLPPDGFNFDHSRCQLPVLVRRRRKNLSVIPSNQCEANYKNSCPGCPWLFKLDSSHLCAVEEHGNVTSTPNVGTPLICPMSNEPNRMFLAGILIDNIKCRHKHLPGLYASMPQLRPWIDEQLAKKGILYV